MKGEGLKPSDCTEVKSFADNLRSMLLRHTLQRTLQLVVAGICLVAAVVLSWGVRRSHQVNASVRKQSAEILAEYQGLLERVAAVEEREINRISSTWQHIILDDYYETVFQQGLAADLYLLDSEGRPYISSEGYISEEEQSAFSRQWKLSPAAYDSSAPQISILKGEKRSLIMAKPIYDGEHISGFAVLHIKEKEFSRLCSEEAIRIVLTDPDGWALSPDSNKLLNAIHQLREELLEKKGFCIARDGIYYVVSSDLMHGDLRLYAIWNLTHAAFLMGIIVFFILLILILILIFSRISSKQLAAAFSEDILVLQDALHAACDGDLSRTVNIHSSAELQSIGESYNSMLSSLKKQMADNEALAQVVADEQVKQLGKQFTAHFLFNTLDNIHYMCRSSPELAESMIISLSDLLRYNTHSPNEKVSLAEDMHYIKTYLDIIRIRFQEAFTYEIQMDGALEDYMILKLLLQPLLENALKYGRENRDVLKLLIRVRKEGDQICLECRDNGEGINPPLLKRIQDNLSKPENFSSHLGLYNLHRRIQLTYGKNYGLSLKNENGLVASIRIPTETEPEL